MTYELAVEIESRESIAILFGPLQAGVVILHEGLDFAQLAPFLRH